MLRTIVVRNENFIRGSIKRIPKANLVRCFTYECAKRVYFQRYLFNSNWPLIPKSKNDIFLHWGYVCDYTIKRTCDDNKWQKCTVHVHYAYLYYFQWTKHACYLSLNTLFLIVEFSFFFYYYNVFLAIDKTSLYCMIIFICMWL